MYILDFVIKSSNFRGDRTDASAKTTTQDAGVPSRKCHVTAAGESTACLPESRRDGQDPKHAEQAVGRKPPTPPRGTLTR